MRPLLFVDDQHVDQPVVVKITALHIVRTLSQLEDFQRPESVVLGQRRFGPDFVRYKTAGGNIQSQQNKQQSTWFASKKVLIRLIEWK